MVTVAKIHRYFKSKDAEDAVDTKMLMIHALAFGIYTLSVVIYATAWIAVLNGKNSSA